MRESIGRKFRYPEDAMAETVQKSAGASRGLCTRVDSAASFFLLSRPVDEITILQALRDHTQYGPSSAVMPLHA